MKSGPIQQFLTNSLLFLSSPLYRFGSKTDGPSGARRKRPSAPNRQLSAHLIYSTAYPVSFDLPIDYKIKLTEKINRILFKSIRPGRWRFATRRGPSWPARTVEPTTAAATATTIATASQRRQPFLGHALTARSFPLQRRYGRSSCLCRPSGRFGRSSRSRCGRLEQPETERKSRSCRRCCRSRRRRFPADPSLLAPPALAGPFRRFRPAGHDGPAGNRFFAAATPRLLCFRDAVSPAAAPTPSEPTSRRLSLARQQSGFFPAGDARTGEQERRQGHLGLAGENRRRFTSSARHQADKVMMDALTNL